MKTITILFAMLIACITTQSVRAQSDKTQRTIGIKTLKIKVSGTCSMDKLRIETAATSVDGVKFAFWDQYSQRLTIKFSVFKTEVSDNVQRKIALKGNDTEKYRADDSVYQKLPDCCHYQRKQS